MKFGAVPYVDTIHKQHIKLHEHHHLTYIQMINIQMLQNIIDTTFLVVVHKTL